MGTEEVLSFTIHHLETVLKILPASFHQCVLAQKLSCGFVDEQGEIVLPDRRVNKDARDMEAAVAIMEGNISAAYILFDICD